MGKAKKWKVQKLNTQWISVIHLVGNLEIKIEVWTIVKVYQFQVRKKANTLEFQKLWKVSLVPTLASSFTISSDYDW